MTQRSLADWLSYLEQLHPTAIDMGLERSREVARRLGLGRPAKRVVTVTGTNGKGSTCALLAELLREQGLSVGVYSSPHLLRYNERVRIDGVEAGDAQLCDAFSAVEAARGEISLTYFEMGTLAAFWLFERAGLDFAVLEVGLGGRLDAVNLIDADLALITSIGLDHAEWLGDTRESVAFEKAGILRAGKPALCGDLDPPQPLLEQVTALGAPLYLRGRDYDLALADHGWHWRGLAADGQALALHDLPLLGLPMENAALALQAYALLELPWQAERLAEALRRTRDRSTRSPRPVLERPATPAPAGRRAQSPGRPVPGATPACRSATRTLPGGLRPAGGQGPGWRTGTLDRLGAGLGRCTVADPAFAAGRGAGGGADPAPGSGEQPCGYRRRPGRAVRQGYRG